MEELVYTLAAFAILHFILFIYIGYKAIFACEVIEKCGLTWTEIMCGYGYCDTERYYYDVKANDKITEEKLDLLLEELGYDFEPSKCVEQEAKLKRKENGKQ